MRREELEALVKQSMASEFYMRPGAVLMGNVETIRRANAYVMGLNPGGDPAKLAKPLIETLAAPGGWSSYTHECWRPRCAGGEKCTHLDASGKVLESALVRHQRNMIAIAEALGTTPAGLCSVNAVFGRSTSRARLKAESEHGLREWWQACWPVHKRLLAVVRPRMIVTLGYGEGSSAFGLLLATAEGPSFRKFGDDGRRGGWIFDAKLDLGGGDKLVTAVVGVPHPSYMAPGPVLADMLREFAAGVLTS